MNCINGLQKGRMEDLSLWNSSCYRVGILVWQGWNTSVAGFLLGKRSGNRKLTFVLGGSLVQQKSSVRCKRAEESGATTIQ